MTQHNPSPSPTTTAETLAAIRQGVQSAAAQHGPTSKKTHTHKDSINEKCLSCSGLRDQLDEAQEQIEILRHDLGLNCSVIPQLGMTPTEMRMFGLLMNKQTVPKDVMYRTIYADKISSDEFPTEKVMTVRICAMRKKLRPHGIDVHTIWGLGWRISDDHKAIARSLITELRP